MYFAEIECLKTCEDFFDPEFIATWPSLCVCCESLWCHANSTRRLVLLTKPAYRSKFSSVFVVAWMHLESISLDNFIDLAFESQRECLFLALKSWVETECLVSSPIGFSDKLWFQIELARNTPRRLVKQARYLCKKKTSGLFKNPKYMFTCMYMIKRWKKTKIIYVLAFKK